MPDSFFDEDEKRRMSEFAAKLQEGGRPLPSVLTGGYSDPKSVDDPGEWKGRYRVTERMCDRMTERVEQGDELESVGHDFGVSGRVVRYHADGECKHDHGAVIDPDRCATIRTLARDGLTYVDIAQWLDGIKSDTAVRSHAKGACTCSKYHDVPPLAEQRVEDRAAEASPTQCDEWRQRVRSGETTPNQIAAEKDTDHSAQRIRAHVYGRCECDGAEDPLPESECTPSVTATDCARWRRKGRDGSSALSISEEPDEDFSSKTVAYHMYGRCSQCEHEVPPVEK